MISHGDICSQFECFCILQKYLPQTRQSISCTEFPNGTAFYDQVQPLKERQGIRPFVTFDKRSHSLFVSEVNSRQFIRSHLLKGLFFQEPLQLPFQKFISVLRMRTVVKVVLQKPNG